MGFSPVIHCVWLLTCFEKYIYCFENVKDDSRSVPKRLGRTVNWPPNGHGYLAMLGCVGMSNHNRQTKHEDFRVALAVFLPPMSLSAVCPWQRISDQ